MDGTVDIFYRAAGRAVSMPWVDPERHFLTIPSIDVPYPANAQSSMFSARMNICVAQLFVDLDGAPIEPVLEATPKPDIVVETSKGRYHAYWVVKDVPLDKFKLYQRTLIEKFDADPACTDIPRTMRLPGFFHQKRDPFFVRIISIDEALGGYA